MQNGFVGFNILTVGLAPQTNNSEDITATQRVQDFYHGWYLHPFIFGDYSETMKKIVRLRLPSFTKKKSNLFMMEHLLRRYKAVGIRLDSGDLAYLSCQARKIFCCIEKEFAVSGFGKTSITASNDLNEETLDALNKQGHEVDAYGIGTYLVTCYAQAALGIVFKLVEINKQPRIKLSEDVSKVSIPCKKKIYRLYGKESYPLVDIMTGEDEPPPKVGERILCRHPFEESKRAYVVPQHVEELLRCYSAGTSGKETEPLPPLKDIRERCIQQLEKMRPDHMRRLNPTPYKVSVSGKLYDFIHFLWLNEAPVGELL